MQDKPKKQALKVYCYKCKSDELTDCCVVCSRCRSEKIGIEESEEMHQLCKLFASRKGWIGDPKPFSLPGFFQAHPEHLKDWEALKKKLTNPEALKLPELKFGEKLTRQSAWKYWMIYSGVLSLSSWADGGGRWSYGGLEYPAEIVKGFIAGYPIAEKLANAYVDFHRERNELTL